MAHPRKQRMQNVLSERVGTKLEEYGDKQHGDAVYNPVKDTSLDYLEILESEEDKELYSEEQKQKKGSKVNVILGIFLVLCFLGMITIGYIFIKNAV